MNKERIQKSKKALVSSDIDKIVKELGTLEKSWKQEAGTLDLATRTGRQATYTALMRVLINELKKRVKDESFSTLTTRGLLDVLLQIMKSLAEETAGIQKRPPLVNINLGEKSDRYNIERSAPIELKNDSSADKISPNMGTTGEAGKNSE